jgi:hypothetical protein
VAISTSDTSRDVPAADGPTPGRRVIDRLDPRIVNVLTVLGFGLPVLGYFFLVGRYSVNVIVGDQFDDVTVIRQTYAHLFDWSALWAQHNENRIFFPNLIVVLLARTTHFNIQVEEYLSAIMLVVATTLLIWAHKRRSPSTPWLYYCPVALLAFSVVQFENSLWGFQMAWYLVLLSMASAVVFLDRSDLTWLVFVGAVAAAVVGSFSSLQGLFIWPAGLVLLYHRRRRPSFAISWIAVGAAAVILYFRNFSFSSSTGILSIGWHHPSGAVRFFFFAVGEIVGFRVDQHGSANRAVSLLGLFIVVLAVTTVVVYGIRRDAIGGSPIGVALICVGLLFAVFIAEGRAYYGYGGASASRYTTFDLLIPIGVYLALLGRPPARTSIQLLSGLGTGRRPIRALSLWVDRTGTRVARWAIAAVIVVQIPLGLHYGLQAARQRHVGQVAAAQVLRHFDHASDGAVADLYFGQPVPFIRRQARTAEKYHLSVFASAGGRP